MKNPKSLVGMASSLIVVASVLAQNKELPAIVPQPCALRLHDGNWTPGEGNGIQVGPGAKGTAEYLQAQIRMRTGLNLAVFDEPSAKAGSILLTTNDASPALGAEGYALDITSEQVVIRAPASAGLFYGCQTLLQLLPLRSEGGKWSVQCLSIEEQPRFRWRGLMLDVSRHFFTKEQVEQLLDEMAWHKINVFHWHLTDDQGWRIEIKKYPRLTQIGAWRKSIGFGLNPKDSTAYGPDGRYGGYYTQQDIREVVAYAQARHIIIVPEIEMPGHSSAALMAYPQFSCTGGPFTTDLPGGVFNGVYCVGNEATFSFLQDVLSEVFALFPGPYIHVGGDEVPTDNWKHCPKCQARMREEGMTNEIQLESYLIRRMETFIDAHHKRLVGWSEIRNGGLAPSATVMDWVGGAAEAAAVGHDVVMSPLADCYFDHYQSQDHSTEPRAIGGYLPLSQVYAFEPIPAGLPAALQSHILGAQGNVWTEYMGSFSYVQYMVFPRLCALSEVLWSPKDARNWDDFERRAKVDCARLGQLGVNYRPIR